MPKQKPWGWEGTRGRPKLRKAVAALSDETKRKRKFEATVADNQRRIKRGKKPRTISERDKDRLIRQLATITRRAAEDYVKRAIRLQKKKRK